ncbi:MAG TPA: hypothetical protein VKK79_06110 [Candidatus Lokiarchaeia archaeon]|nr:hypothetical protein [Candidatus Lokiarchaeia archaeon]
MIDPDDDEYAEYLKKDRKGQVLSVLKGLAIVALFVLSYYLIQLGFSGGTGGTSYITLGFLLICLLSTLMSIQPKKKKNKRHTLTILGCTDPQCKGKKVRDYQDGDYVFKEEGKCAQCNGMLRIEEIYSVKLKNPKDIKPSKREKKIEIVPKQ